MATYSGYEQRQMDARTGEQLDRRAERASAHDERREAMARLLAAAMMQLHKDATGAKLPAACWQVMLSKADAVLFIITGNDKSGDDLVMARPAAGYEPINQG